tara:strand:- start:8433 stop:9290 length:858 start_codon:yes stop_codon:yes gene_type:complete
MSTRKITPEQFSDGSTIDGSRIARALQDIIEMNNEVPLDSISKPRSPQFMILGGYPPQAAAGALTTSPPWLNYNLADATGEPIFRAKGIVASIGAGGAIPTDDGGLWTVSTLFDRPVIIDTICVHIDSWTPWPISLTGPTAGALGDASLLQILVDTDNVTSPEDRTVNSKEYHYRQYDPTIWRALDLNNAAAPTVDMAPPPPTALKDGTAPAAGHYSHVIERKDLNIPIHQMARVRFRLAFARRDTSTVAPGQLSWETGGSSTMNPGQPTWVIVYREQVRGQNNQ